MEVHKELTLRLALNAFKKDWMDEVRVILWGPTEKLAIENNWFKEQIKFLIDSGLEVYACKACSDEYGVSQQLADLGVNVDYMGRFTVKMLKEGWHQLTF